MPTRRFNYKAYSSIKIGDTYLNSSNAGNLITENANLTGNVSLPITTTFNSVPLGDAATTNITNTLENDSTKIPSSAAVLSGLNSISNDYLAYIQPYEIPEFVLKLPVEQVFKGEIFYMDLYATSTGPKEKYLKSFVGDIVYSRLRTTTLAAGVTFVSIENSLNYTAVAGSSQDSGNTTKQQFTLTANYNSVNLEKPYRDLHLCRFIFTLDDPTDYRSKILNQLQITSILDGDDTDYTSQIVLEDLDNFDLIGNVKVAYLKNFNNKLSLNRGEISVGGHVKVSNLTSGAYGIGANVLRVDTTTGEIQRSTN